MHSFLVEQIIDKYIKRVFDLKFYSMLLELLNECIRDKKLTGVLHPLGFIIITFKDWKNDQRFRLHIWPKVGRKYNNDQLWIHNHEYSVDSLVINGSLTNFRYDVDKDALQRSFPIYNVFYNSNNSDLIATNETCNVLLTKKEKLISGSFYTIKRWNYHLVKVEEDNIACTLVLNYEKDISTGYVIGSKGILKPVFPYARDYYDATELRNLLLTLISNLTAKLEFF